MRRFSTALGRARGKTMLALNVPLLVQLPALAIHACLNFEGSEHTTRHVDAHLYGEGCYQHP
jgi:hypothetical protein